MLLRTKNLTLKYKNKIIVNDLNINFPIGKITTICGLNGAGKSTILKALSNNLKPFSGNVLLDDVEIGKIKKRDLAKSIAYLPQNNDIYGDVDLYTYVSYGRYPYQSMFGKLSPEDDKIILSSLEMCGLTALRDRLISTLSGGEFQRARIALTLCQKTSILILDEPITFLDVSYQIEILKLINKLSKALNLTIIMVLHDLNLAVLYSDYIAVIDLHTLALMTEADKFITNENLRLYFNLNSVIITDGLYMIAKKVHNEN